MHILAIYTCYICIVTMFCSFGAKWPMCIFHIIPKHLMCTHLFPKTFESSPVPNQLNQTLCKNGGYYNQNNKEYY